MADKHLSITFEFAMDADGHDQFMELVRAAEKLGIFGTDTTEPIKAPPLKSAPLKSAPPKAAAPAKSGNSKAKLKAAPDPLDLSDVAGDNDDEDDEDSGGLGLADELGNGSITPAEAHEAAMDKLRTLMAAGHRAEVKEVQQLMQVVKFSECPKERGHELLQAVNAVEAKMARGK